MNFVLLFNVTPRWTCCASQWFDCRVVQGGKGNFSLRIHTNMHCFNRDSFSSMDISCNGRARKEIRSWNIRLYAESQNNMEYQGSIIKLEFSMLWLRKDWLEQHRLSQFLYTHVGTEKRKNRCWYNAIGFTGNTISINWVSNIFYLWQTVS